MSYTTIIVIPMRNKELSRVFKIYEFSARSYRIFDVDKGLDKWVTPLGVRLAREKS